MTYHCKIKLNKSLKNFPIGAIITIKTDNQGNPTDSYWASRLKDAEIDNCIEIVKKGKKKTKPKSKSKDTTENTESQEE